MPSSSVTHLSVISSRRDPELARVHAALASTIEVSSRNDLADQLGRALVGREAPPAPATLDLIGHAMAGTCLLRVGDWVVDAAQSSVTSFFRELAEYDVLPRLGITAVRLLGCVTAGSAQSRSTICTLADLLGVEVYGTTDMICAQHYDAAGFSDRYAGALVASSALRGEAPSFESRTTTTAYARALDLDGLPTVALPLAQAPGWPLHVLDRSRTAEVLHMVRRHEGAEMPGLLATPGCELALPTGSGAHVLAQVLMNGEFVRVFPRDVRSGIVYPVADTAGLRRLVQTLASPQ